MRITDLLDARSISLDCSPKTKQEALDTAVALMVKSGKINDEEAYRRQVMQEKKKVQQEQEKELQFLMENVMP